ncbi:MAG: hypothetical protein PVF33_06080 [Candidatus Latescibacterota bacterium]
MNRAFRIAFHTCIMLSLVALVGCSDDDTATPAAPAPEPAAGGTVGIYTNAAGTNRDIVDNGGTVTLYVVHKITNSCISSQFRIEEPEGWTLIGADHQYDLHLGDFEHGIAYAYGSCTSGTLHLATLTYQAPGNSAGSTFKVVEQDNETPLQVIDCSDNRITDCVGLTSMVSAP